MKDSRGGYVLEFGRLPEYSGLGIGRMLIDATVEDAKTKGIHRLEYWSQDRAAQRYYARLGMKEISRHYRFRMKPTKEVTDLLVAGLGVGYKMSKTWSFKFSWWWLNYAEDGAASTSGATDSNIGNEFDFWATWNVMKAMKMHFLFSYLVVGDAIEETDRRPNELAEIDVAASGHTRERRVEFDRARHRLP